MPEPVVLGGAPAPAPVTAPVSTPDPSGGTGVNTENWNLSENTTIPVEPGDFMEGGRDIDQAPTPGTKPAEPAAAPAPAASPAKDPAVVAAEQAAARLRAEVKARDKKIRELEAARTQPQETEEEIAARDAAEAAEMMENPAAYRRKHEAIKERRDASRNAWTHARSLPAAKTDPDYEARIVQIIKDSGLNDVADPMKGMAFALREYNDLYGGAEPPAPAGKTAEVGSQPPPAPAAPAAPAPTPAPAAGLPDASRIDRMVAAPAGGASSPAPTGGSGQVSKADLDACDMDTEEGRAKYEVLRKRIPGIPQA